MASDREFRRAIVRRVTAYEERTSSWGGGFNWSRTKVHTITPECGHDVVRRGTSPPTRFVVCKRCKAGRAPVPVVGPLGVIDALDREIKDPVARAFIGEMMRKAGHDAE